MLRAIGGKKGLMRLSWALVSRIDQTSAGPPAALNHDVTSDGILVCRGLISGTSKTLALYHRLAKVHMFGSCEVSVMVGSRGALEIGDDDFFHLEHRAHCSGSGLAIVAG
jgi:hypothetical protein